MPAMIEPAGKHEEPQTLQPLRGGGDISDDSTDSVPRKRPTVLQSVALISVPVLWGTFTPTMKVLLDDRHPPPVILTNLSSHAVGAASLVLLWALEASRRRTCIPEDSQENDGGSESRPRALMASCELGVYLFFGQLTQLVGLSGTSATTNAILVQSSVVFVPLLEGGPRKRTMSHMLRHFGPSVLALGGIAILTIVPSLIDSGDGLDEHARNERQTSLGILCSLLSALFYALHTVRLTAYGDVDATVQAAGQVTMNALLDIVAMPFASLFHIGGSPRR